MKMISSVYTRFDLYNRLLDSPYSVNLFVIDMFILPHSLTRSQSYQTLISSFFRFLLLSLSVCCMGKYCLYNKMANLSSKKWKNIHFMKKKVW